MGVPPRSSLPLLDRSRSHIRGATNTFGRIFFAIPAHSLVFVVLTWLSLTLHARSEDKAGDGRWSIFAECQMVVLPQKAAWPLLPDLDDDEKVEAAWAKMQRMIEHGEATLIANLTVRGQTGVKLVSASVEELRYAVEFTPPEVPNSVPKEKAVEVLKNWPIVGITPTAFESRDVGPSLELTATVSNDGQWVSLDVLAQHTRFLRFAKIDAGILPSGARLSVEQPHFSSLRDVFTMHVRAGQRVLLGTHKVPAEENNMELFFLRVRPEWTGKAK
jgi:hypothetical protein